jgi:guanylate kinase
MKNILIIAGPSAVGKTTIANALFAADPRFEFVRSVTTRAPRGDSFDDEYIYISQEEFRHLIDTAGVLEYTEYAGNLYGTPRSEIDRITAEGRIPLLVLDINGVHSLYNNKGDINPCGVYVYDDLCVMEQRLYARYEGDYSRMESRIKQNRIDYVRIPSFAPVFYAFVRNGITVEEGRDKIAAVFRNFENNVPKNPEYNMQIATELSAAINCEK